MQIEVAEEVQVDEDQIDKDEEMAMYAKNQEVLVLEQMVKFEKEMDVIEQDENENQKMKKSKVIKMDLKENFYLQEDHLQIVMCHFLMVFH